MPRFNEVRSLLAKYPVEVQAVAVAARDLLRRVTPSRTDVKLGIVRGASRKVPDPGSEPSNRLIDRGERAESQHKHAP
jgi:hypothetical protein